MSLFYLIYQGNLTIHDTIKYITQAFWFGIALPSCMSFVTVTPTMCYHNSYGMTTVVLQYSNCNTITAVKLLVLQDNLYNGGFLVWVIFLCDTSFLYPDNLSPSIDISVLLIYSSTSLVSIWCVPLPSYLQVCVTHARQKNTSLLSQGLGHLSLSKEYFCHLVPKSGKLIPF